MAKADSRHRKLTREEKGMILFLLRHLFYGCFGGFVFGAALLYFDIAHIRSMAMSSPYPWLVFAMLFAGLFITFGSVGMGAGIMTMGKDEE